MLMTQVVVMAVSAAPAFFIAKSGTGSGRLALASVCGLLAGAVASVVGITQCSINTEANALSSCFGIPWFALAAVIGGTIIGRSQAKHRNTTQAHSDNA